MEEFAFQTEVLNSEQGPFVTLMLNTHVGHSGVDQDVLQVKNLAKQAKERFIKKHSPQKWEPFQLQIDRLLQDRSFFRQGAKALAIIFTAEKTFTYPLDISVDYQYYVSDLPYLLALIKNLQFNYSYYLLGLNRDSMELFQVTHQRLEPVMLPEDAPTTMKIALGEELTGGHLNYTSQGGGGKGSKEGLAYHGVSTKDAEEEIDLKNYFQAVDNFLKEFLPDKKQPLYVLALPENQAIFKKYAKLEQYHENPSIPLAPSANTPKEIQKELPKMTEALSAAEVKDYNQLLNRKFIDQLVDIRENARLGKISHLFIATSNLKDGFGEDPDTEYDRRQVLNKIAYDVLVSSGEVHVLEQKDSPDEKSLVAILRY